MEPYKDKKRKAQTWVILRRTMHHSTHAIRTARLGIGRLPGAHWRASHRSPIARIIRDIIMPRRHRGRTDSTTAGSRHTRRLTLGEGTRKRCRGQRRWSITRTQGDSQALELVTTQCRSQRRRLHGMLATIGRWLIAGGAVIVVKFTGVAAARG